MGATCEDGVALGVQRGPSGIFFADPGEHLGKVVPGAVPIRGELFCSRVVFFPPRVGAPFQDSRRALYISQETASISSSRRCWYGEHFAVNRRVVVWEDRPRWFRRPQVCKPPIESGGRSVPTVELAGTSKESRARPYPIVPPELPDTGTSPRRKGASAPLTRACQETTLVVGAAFPSTDEAEVGPSLLDARPRVRPRAVSYGTVLRSGNAYIWWVSTARTCHGPGIILRLIPLRWA